MFAIRSFLLHVHAPRVFFENERLKICGKCHYSINALNAPDSLPAAMYRAVFFKQHRVMSDRSIPIKIEEVPEIEIPTTAPRHAVYAIFDKRKDEGSVDGGSC